MKTAAVVVLYEPDREALDRARAYAGSFDLVLCMDNSREEHGAAFAGEGRIRYFFFGENRGLAAVYNEAMELALREGCEALCLLDQDSEFSPEAIAAVRRHMEEDALREQTVIYAPAVRIGESPAAGGGKTETVPWAINSGSFLNLRLARAHGLRYDENYFLDRLDRDFCRQAENAGLLIRRCGDAVLKQQLGVLYKGRNIHSPLRNYYTARNRLYYNRKYLPFPKRAAADALQTARHVWNILSAGKDVPENLRMIARGIRDHRKGRYGKIPDGE